MRVAFREIIVLRTSEFPGYTDGVFLLTLATLTLEETFFTSLCREVNTVDEGEEEEDDDDDEGLNVEGVDITAVNLACGSSASPFYRRQCCRELVGLPHETGCDDQVEGGSSGQTLDFVDLELRVPLCCSAAMPILPNFQLP